MPFNLNSRSFARCLVALSMLLEIAAPVNVLGQDFGGFDDFGGSQVGEGGFVNGSLSGEGWYDLRKDSRVGKIYVRVFIKEGYHCYSQYHGGGETKSRFEITKSQQFKVLGKFEPDRPPHKEKKSGEDYETFEEDVTWSAPFVLAEGVVPKDLTIKLTYHGQACDARACDFPVAEPVQVGFDGYNSKLVLSQALLDQADQAFSSEDSSLDSPVVSETPVAKSHRAESPEAKTSETPAEIAALAELYDVKTEIKFERLDGSTGNGGFMTALVGAFLGGMLLNLMPCVFPVLGLKVMGFVEQAGNDPKKIKMHGLAFAAGLIFSMWVLAGVILAIKASGSDVTWGQQMGNAYFIGGVVILLFALGLNLAGVFEMGLFMTRVGSGKKQSGYTGSFVSGIITTLVATPCSGPFLGAAMGYTLAQPPVIALFLFTVFGIGIAMPYLLMSFFPSLINMLPRPGEWMETFKKLMAFTLFAAAAFFAKSFGVITGYDGIGLFLMALCVIALGLFFYGTYSPSYIKGSKRYVWGWIAPLLICGAGLWMYTSAARYEAPILLSKVSEDGWYPWVPGRVEEQLAMGRPVWVDYTANW